MLGHLGALGTGLTVAERHERAHFTNSDIAESHVVSCPRERNLIQHIEESRLKKPEDFMELFVLSLSRQKLSLQNLMGEKVHLNRSGRTNRLSVDL